MRIQKSKPTFEVIHRPNPQPMSNIALPFYPRSVGHFKIRAGETEFVPAGEKPFVQIFWTISGGGIFRLGEEEVPVRPGDVFYHLPLEPHDHATGANGWEYRWITFDGPLAEEYMRGYGFSSRCTPSGSCPHNLFIRFGLLMQEMTPFCWREMVSIISAILARVGGGEEDDGSREAKTVADIIRLCRKNFPDPDLNVNAIANEFSLSRSTVRRQFKAKMEITPSEYLANLRLQHALSLLQQTRLPLAEVARRSGIPEVSYFCRFIRQNIGETPESFRRGKI
jgi:AraC-like DNA-binding protein